MSDLETKNYYELLNVTKEATVEEIKTSYREIARVYHPDSNFYSEIIQDPLEGEEMSAFKRITAAYNTLVDAEKRSQYNETLPPDLKDWEDTHTDLWNKGGATHSGIFAAPRVDISKLQQQQRPVTSGAVFGAAPRKSMVEQMFNHDVQSMADIMRSQGTRLDGGFWHRVLRFLRLKY